MRNMHSNFEVEDSFPLFIRGHVCFCSFFRIPNACLYLGTLENTGAFSRHEALAFQHHQFRKRFRPVPKTRRAEARLFIDSHSGPPQPPRGGGGSGGTAASSVKSFVDDRSVSEMSVHDQQLAFDGHHRQRHHHQEQQPVAEANNYRSTLLAEIAAAAEYRANSECGLMSRSLSESDLSELCGGGDSSPVLQLVAPPGGGKGHFLEEEEERRRRRRRRRRKQDLGVEKEGQEEEEARPALPPKSQAIRLQQLYQQQQQQVVSPKEGKRKVHLTPATCHLWALSS